MWRIRARQRPNYTRWRLRGPRVGPQGHSFPPRTSVPPSILATGWPLAGVDLRRRASPSSSVTSRPRRGARPSPRPGFASAPLALLVPPVPIECGTLPSWVAVQILHPPWCGPAGPVAVIETDPQENRLALPNPAPTLLPGASCLRVVYPVPTAVLRSSRRTPISAVFLREPTCVPYPGLAGNSHRPCSVSGTAEHSPAEHSKCGRRGCASEK